MLTSHGHTSVWSGGKEIVLSFTRSLSLIQNRPATLLLYGVLVESEEGRGQVDLVGNDYFIFYKKKQDKTKKKSKERKRKIVLHGLQPEATFYSLTTSV